MSPCQWFRECIFDLFDGELDIARRKELERHMKECPHCASFLNQIRILKSHLRNLMPIKTSDNFQILLREKIRREVAGKRTSAVPSFYITRRWVHAFGIALIVITVGFWVLDHHQPIFRSQENAFQAIHSSSSFESRFDGNIQYVVGDFTDRISISRENKKRSTETPNEDSLRLQKNLEEIKARLTPVSF